MQITIQLDTLRDEAADVARVLDAVSGRSKPTVLGVDMAGEIDEIVSAAPTAQEAFASVEPNEDLIPPEKKQEIAQQVFADAQPAGNVAETAVETQAEVSDATTTGTFSDTGAGAAVEVDDHNYPWHEEIHTAGKTKMGSSGKRANCWKYKPKTDKALIAQIEAQDRANGFGPDTPSIPQPTQPEQPASTVPVPEVEKPAPLPDVSGNPTASEIADNMTYLQLFKIISADTTSGVVPNGVSQQICAELGINNPMDLNAKGELVKPFYQTWEKVKALLTLQPDVAGGLVANWATYKGQGIL